MDDSSKNSEIEELENRLETDEKGKRHKKIIILLLLLLLLLIVVIILIWKNKDDKPAITLGEKDINTDYIDETPTPTVENKTPVIDDTNPEIPVKPTLLPIVIPTQNPIHINKEFIVTSKNKQWRENLGIFDSEKYNNKPIIYPGIKNTYYFELTNKQDFDIVCEIEFKETNKENIPIKYKLKENGKYIKGSEDKYVNCDELDTKDILVSSNSKNKYELEWKWENDTQNDNAYGDKNKDITYEIEITINAKEK